MNAGPRFRCSTCGEEHKGLPTDSGFKLPDDVWAIAEPERSSLAHFTTDLCSLGERRFIRGVFSIPFTERNGSFGWGVWAEVDRDAFARYLELYDVDAESEPMRGGVLANRIAGYDDAREETLLVKFGSKTERPTFFARPDSSSSLARDQQRGLDESRYHAMVIAAGLATVPARDFSCVHVCERGAPVLLAAHNHDGSWEFVCGEDHADDEIVLLHKSHLIDRDPALGALLDLAPGWDAWRDDARAPWQREPFEEEDEDA